MTENTQALATTQPDLPNAFAAANKAKFELAQRQAHAFASSTMVPAQYRGNIPNVLIATELAERIGCSVFAIMQNVHIIQGNPSMSAKFLIATVNACGRFSPLRFRWSGDPDSDDYGCRAVAKDVGTGEECIGALISWRMVKAEGWNKKKGSKWLTMSEQMFMYRAAAFWQRIFAPELSLGMKTNEEARDMAPQGFIEVTGGTSSLSASLKQLDSSDLEYLDELAEPEQAPPSPEPTPEPIPLEDPPAPYGEDYGGDGK